jgi:hypothetical protein
MEKREIILHNTVKDNVFRYLSELTQAMRGREIKYGHPVIYPDGTRNVTYHYRIQFVFFDQNNQLVVNYSLDTEPEGEPTKLYPNLIPAINFRGLQLQVTTVLLTVEFEPLFKPFVDEIWDNLLKTFEQDPPKKGKGRDPDPKHDQVYNSIKNEGISITEAMKNAGFNPYDPNDRDKVNHAIRRRKEKTK